MSPCRWNLLRTSLVSLFVVVSTLCADDGATKEGLAHFEQHIRPLLAERCYACHSNRSKKQKGGLLLDSRSGLAEGGDQGPAVVPGDPNASLLIRAVRYTDPDLQMPPDGPLPKEAVARLEHWVKMGAPDPRQSHSVEKEREANPSDPILGRQHWAFRPLKEYRPPAVDSWAWPRSPIDSFTLKKLEANHFLPVQDADRPTLIRRTYFQLIGLPPAREAVAAFLEDKRPDAYERLVDQLLSSQQFGETWGRHWL